MQTRTTHLPYRSLTKADLSCRSLTKAERALCRRAFTIIEMLTVMGIILLVVAIAAPSLHSFSHNVTAAATRQMLDAVSRARQLAISQRTTVYMVFVPDLSALNPATLTPAQQAGVTNLIDKQLIGYAFVSLRSLGDQPGRNTARYLSSWKTLPEGSFICTNKFLLSDPQTAVLSIPNLNPGNLPPYQVFAFAYTNNIPFPTESDFTGVWLPYIAFSPTGQLVSQRDELIPLAKGAANGRALSFIEQPPGNSISAYNIIRIEWLTGRARVERREMQ